ncbi:transcription factor ORG2-like [Chenopodium quinoa]|uniref:transcription factor ORG2-like n=1 Tax=Chenopodium quinoa TaxID=63459 RepID=UPI000B77C168|nr:transcription factor ORG2-like [Chenopodium quinoa]
MSSICPTYLGWEYPIELGTNQGFNNVDLDAVFLLNFSSSQSQDYQFQVYDHVKRSELPQDTSSTDHQFDINPVLSKKLSHNASERVRRKKISNLYSSLRALLPSSDHKKKLSIPGTVVRVVEYIPELQKEVEKLICKKEELLSKISAIQGNALENNVQEEKPMKNCMIKDTISCSISSNKLGDKEMVIQISAFERISLYEVLDLLEKKGYLVIDISSFHSFGGRTFYNIHLWMGGNYTAKFENLNEVLMSLLKEQKHMQAYY